MIEAIYARRSHRCTAPLTAQQRHILCCPVKRIGRNWRVLPFQIACAVALTSCSSNWKVVDVSADTKPSDILAMNIYAPYDAAKLFDLDVEEIYGMPSHSGVTDRGVSFIEYKGEHGRIRICDEHYRDEESWEDARWIQFFPSSLYVRDVLNEQYSKAATSSSNSKLTIHAADNSWLLTFEFDEGAIVKIVHHVN